MNNKKIIIIGNIGNSNSITGPENVLINLINQYSKNNVKFRFINTFTQNIIDRIKLIFSLVKILFYRDCIINVHSFGYKVAYIVLLISKVNKSNKYFLTLHGLMSSENAFYKNEVKLSNSIIEKKILKYFPNIICVSNKQKELIARSFNRKENVVVIYNGINMEVSINELYIKKIENEIKVIMAGGIFNIKGIFELINLVKYYNDLYTTNIYLDIYGGYESEDVLKEFNVKIKKMGIDKYVNYCGRIENKILLNKFKEAHFSIALSKFDTFNMTILESMSKGIPAIVSKEVGICELIDNNINGFIVDMKEDYCIKISNIINLMTADNNKYAEVCKNSYDIAMKNSWNRVFKRYICLFKEN